MDTQFNILLTKLTIETSQHGKPTNRTLPKYDIHAHDGPVEVMAIQTSIIKLLDKVYGSVSYHSYFWLYRNLTWRVRRHLSHFCAAIGRLRRRRRRISFNDPILVARIGHDKTATQLRMDQASSCPSQMKRLKKWKNTTQRKK